MIPASVLHIVSGQLPYQYYMNTISMIHFPSSFIQSIIPQEPGVKDWQGDTNNVRTCCLYGRAVKSNILQDYFTGRIWI